MEYFGKELVGLDSPMPAAFTPVWQTYSGAGQGKAGNLIPTDLVTLERRFPLTPAKLGKA